MSPPRSTRSSSTPSQSLIRLFIGNLQPSVSEYDLVALFSPHGKIAKLDLLFHKSGPLKGKPRGYAFVEYVKEEDAAVAKGKLAGIDVKGRRLAVSFASKADYAGDSQQSSSTGPIRRKPRDDDLKPTTLSLVKSSQKLVGTDAKIAAMDAKLKALKAARGQPDAAAKDQTVTAMTKATSLKPVPATAGLPKKPITR